MARSKGGFARWLIIITVVGLIVRVGYVLIFRLDNLPFGGDALIYQRSGNVLAQGYGFGSPFRPNLPFADHPPLYIIWVAIPALFNHGYAPQWVDLVWSCVLGTATVAVTGLAGREIAGPRVGLIAAGVAAVYPNVWLWDGMLHSETMSLFTIALVLWLAYRYWHAPSLARVLWLGGACGLAALARAELILTLPFVILPLLLFTRSRSFLTQVKWGIAAGLVALVVIGPWVAYNLNRFKDPVYLSTGSGQTLAAANCPVVFSGKYIGWKSYECQIRAALEVIHEKDPDVVNPSLAHPPGLDRSELDVGMRAIAKDYIDAHRDELPAVVLARWGRAFQVYHPTLDMRFNQRSLRQEPWLSWSALFSYYALVALAIGGAVILRRRRIPVYPLLAFPVIVLISVATTFGQLRYRASAEIAFVLLGAVAIDALITRFWPQPPSEETTDPAPVESPTPATV